MRYREAVWEDIPACNACINSTSYYDRVNLEEFGGHMVVAEDDKDGIVGCIWACVSNKFAFADFLAVNPKYKHLGIGIRLIIKGRLLMRSLGVKHILYAVHGFHPEMGKIMDAFGDKADGPYALASIELGD